MVYFCLAVYLGIKSCNHVSYIVIIYYFLHGRRKLIAEIPIFASLYHLFCGFKNAQRQSCVCGL